MTNNIFGFSENNILPGTGYLTDQNLRIGDSASFANITAKETFGSEITDMSTWTDPVAGWEYTGGKWNCIGGTEILLVDDKSALFEIGHRYRLVLAWTIEEWDYITVSLGGITTYPTGGYLTTIPNPYILDFTAWTTDRLTIQGGSENCSIDSISIKEITDSEIFGNRLKINQIVFGSAASSDPIEPAIKFTDPWGGVGGISNEAWFTGFNLDYAGKHMLNISEYLVAEYGIMVGAGDLDEGNWTVIHGFHHGVQIDETNTSYFDVHLRAKGVIGTDKQGCPFVLQGGASNGTGLEGKLIFETSGSGLSGSTPNTYAQRGEISSTGFGCTVINNADSDTNEIDSVVWLSGYGLLIAASITDGTAAVWKLKGTTLEAIEVDVDWTAVKDNVSTYNVYFEGGAIKLQNKVGDNKVLKLGFYGV
jgi:hypothetical protein